MMLKLLLLSLLLRAGWSSAQQDDEPSSSNPCASVSQSVKDFTPSPEEPYPKVPARLAYDCLKSVPINVERASELLHSLSSYADFQTTFAYLEDPPLGYPYPPVDIPGQMRNITEAVENGRYEKEYDYAADLFTLYQQSRDSHFTFHPDILFSAFAFRRPITLTSISEDGQKLPQIYSYDDWLPGSSITPSPIFLINGGTVTAFLEEVLVGECHDPDVCFNAMLYTPNFLSNRHEGLGYFAQPNLYPGDETEIMFDNGTTVTLSNYAEVIGNFTNVDSAETFYSRFCNLTLNETQEFRKSIGTKKEELREARASEDNIFEGYPASVMAMENQKLAGYFLNDTKMNDVAILSIPTFNPGSSISGPQSFLEEFLNLCREKDMKKLVVDVQGNIGGLRSLGVDFFAQVFPDITPQPLERYRAHESANLIGKELAEFFSDKQILEPDNATPLIAEAYNMAFNYKSYLRPNGEPFESYEKFYGPYETYGENYSAVHQVDFDKPAHLYIDDAYPTPFGNRSNSTDGLSRAFDDVIILTDGACGSTCSLFVDLMTRQANVPTVTFGGRPFYGPMLAVGETRGPRSFTVSDLYTLVESIAAQATDEQLAAIEQTRIANMTDVPMLRAAPGEFPSTINFLDAIRPDDKSETPLQFIYEAADCRLFRTPDMLNDVTEMWRAVAKVMNGDYEACVTDSMGQRTNDENEISEIVEERASNSTSSGVEDNDGSSNENDSDEESGQGGSESGADSLRMTAGNISRVGVVVVVVNFLMMM